MVLSLAFILAFIGAGVALLIGIIVFSEVEQAMAQTFGVPITNGTGGGFVTDNSILFSCTYPASITNEINSVTLFGFVETFPLSTASISGMAHDGCLGLAQDPTTSIWYAIYRTDDGDPTLNHLVTLNLQTGVGASVGLLPDGMQSMAFDKDGNLFTYTNSNAVPVNTVYEINKATGASLGTCTDGGGGSHVALGYDYTNEKIYLMKDAHFGFGTVIVEIDPTVAGCDFQTPVSTTGAFNNADFVAMTWDTNTELFYGSAFSPSSYEIYTINTVTGGTLGVTTPTAIDTQKGLGFEISSGGGGTPISQVPPEFAQASNIAYTVIGIIPVALFFFLFAIFGGRVE